MNLELSDIMKKDGRLVDWANTVKYNIASVTAEDKEISEVIDQWAKNIGKTGHDANHELAALITKSVTSDNVIAPSELVDRMFDQESIGEFDDFRMEVEPENKIVVYDAITGGNVNRSFIDHKIVTPTWTNLQAETDVSLADLRHNGYKSVANLVSYIREALENKKISKITSGIASAITSGNNYVSESTTAPTNANMLKMALYLNDMATEGTPFIFGLNKYIQTVGTLSGVTNYLTDTVKDQWNRTGEVKMFGGCDLFGYSGQRKLGDGSLVVPDYALIGIAGKLGSAITRGETRVLEETDINAEKVHIKVAGFTFGVAYKDSSLKNAFKMAIASSST